MRAGIVVNVTRADRLRLEAIVADRSEGGFFAKLTRRRLNAWSVPVGCQPSGCNQPVAEETNSNPKPFVWTADPKRVLAAVKRGKEKLESIH